MANKIHYKVVGDIGDYDGCSFDGIVQTIDTSDFVLFADALDHAKDCVRERISEVKKRETPTPDYLEELSCHLEAMCESEDWEDYTFHVSQPFVSINDKQVNLAEVAGRILCQQHIDAGGKLKESHMKRWEAAKSLKTGSGI